ncbi:MAG: hypothetical protein E4G91_08840 [Candidatus Zixiibacteriota bacterium]|nr:MAG: hypothetical protein E4G91_08840 [candidate division Zixibacteria bacterium]
MRCHEAKKRIDAGDLDDAALAEHLHQCAACSRLAEAERQLTCSLQHAAQATPSVATPFPQLRQRIELATAGTQRKERHIMSEISHQVRIHPRLSTGLALAVLVFLFTTLVPFSYQRISGYDATIAYAGITEEIQREKVEKALESIGQNNVKVSVEQTGENTSYQLKGFASEAEALQAVLALEMQTGTKGQSRIRPILENVSASLYAQVIDGVKSVKDESTEGKTDQEVERDIAAKLLAAGLLSPKVKVTTDADGMRKAIADSYIPLKSGQDSVAIGIMCDMSHDGEIRLRISTYDSTNTMKTGMEPGKKGR